MSRHWMDQRHVLTSMYETYASPCNRHRLAHTLEVESWPASGVLAAFCCEHAAPNLSNREP
jgi:hypothetical protein